MPGSEHVEDLKTSLRVSGLCGDLYPYGHGQGDAEDQNGPGGLWREQHALRVRNKTSET
jgi:hypothetical protein